MRGHIHYICRECGAPNKIYEYVEFINCYACGTGMRSGEKWKAECKKEFPEGISYKPKENVYEKQILKALNLSEDDSKYITVQEDTAYFVFPVRVEIGISVGNKKLQLNDDASDVIYKNICNYFDYELHKGGFTLNDINVHGKFYQNILTGEVEFYKDISNDDEAKEAVKWLTDFKKRFGF